MSRENLKKAIDIISRGPAPAAVFDMDSTLFCMKYRTEAIIKDCASNESFRKAFSKFADQIKQAKVTERDWAVEEVLARLGFEDPEAPVVKAVKRFWRAAFFTNRYLHLDQPYEGGADFVKTLQSAGAEIFYLTARQKKAMWEGTIQSLKHWGFPMAKEENLILKIDGKKLDSEYKRDELKRLAKKFQTVLFFENEPVILNVVAKSLPNIRLFWMDSAHSSQEEPPAAAAPLSMSYKL